MNRTGLSIVRSDDFEKTEGLRTIAKRGFHIIIREPHCTCHWQFGKNQLLLLHVIVLSSVHRGRFRMIVQIGPFPAFVLRFQRSFIMNAGQVFQMVAEFMPQDAAQERPGFLSAG